MTELKTLKDIELCGVVPCYEILHEMSVTSGKLRAEAVKWIKERYLKNKAPLMANYFKCPRCNEIERAYGDTSPACYKCKAKTMWIGNGSIQEWKSRMKRIADEFKHFFNLTEEDLK